MFLNEGEVRKISREIAQQEVKALNKMVGTRLFGFGNSECMNISSSLMSEDGKTYWGTIRDNLLGRVMDVIADQQRQINRLQRKLEVVNRKANTVAKKV